MHIYSIAPYYVRGPFRRVCDPYQQTQLIEIIWFQRVHMLQVNDLQKELGLVCINFLHISIPHHAFTRPLSI